MSFQSGGRRRIWAVAAVVGLATACSTAPGPGSTSVPDASAAPGSSGSAPMSPGNGPDAIPSTAVSLGAAVLRETGCDFDGDLEPDAGPVTIDVTNQTALLGVFELLRLGAGHTREEFGEHVAEEQRRADADEPPLGPPPWVSEITRQELNGHGTARLEAALNSGSYLIVCSLIGDPAPNPIAFIFAVGPIDVAS